MLEFLRRLKYRLIRRLRYRSSYASLSPSGYSRRNFRLERDAAIALYSQMIETIGRQKIERWDASYCHPLWLDWKRRFERSFLRGLPEDFLDDSVVRPNMVRRGWSAAQEFEQQYLLSRRDQLQKIVNSFRESRVGGPFMESETYRCSANSLGHLFYLTRTLELFPHLLRNKHTVVEFGGGYGNFARAYVTSLPSAAYVIIDFPEFLALQHLFLRLNGQDVTIADSPAAEVVTQPGTTHLVPVYQLPAVSLKGDIFVSHFALSEAPGALQELVARKRFFDCRASYLVGQFSDASSAAEWPSHRRLHEVVKSQFESIELRNFHLGDAYELVAQRTARNPDA